MENEISQLDLFSCNNRIFNENFNENNSYSLNYQSLPLIMSALKMDITPVTTASTTSFQSQSVFSVSDAQQKINSISSCSDHENVSNNFIAIEPESKNSITNKIRDLRSSSSESLMRRMTINRRTITKPKKLKDFTLSPGAIKKLYIESGKKLGRFKPSNLETIFEEPMENDTDDQFEYLGKKKLKRSLSCSDGLNVTKATIKSRRIKIKRIFGKRFGLKKINLAEFKERLNSSMVEWDGMTHPSDAVPKENFG